MRHETLDAFARGSRFASLDPRVKLISAVLAIIVLSFLTKLLTLGAMLGLSLLLLVASRVPAEHLLRHYALTLPFIGGASISLALSSGHEFGILLFIRSTASVLLLLLVGSTTPFFKLLTGLHRLRVPKSYVVLLFFIYRYIFVIWDEMDRMERARMARGFVRRGSIRDRHLVRGIIGMAGMILVRAYERGKRSYLSLLSRGFQREIRTLGTLAVKPRDVAFGTLLVGYSLVLASTELEVIW